jgi:transcriptional regulator with XRE-family HTH domain
LETAEAQRRTAPEQPADGRDTLWLGFQIRAARKAKKLSLQQVADRSCLSISMLSQIERGVSSPSIRSLRSLCDALEVEPAHFFTNGAAPPATEIGKIVRKENRRTLKLPTKGISKEILTPATTGALELVLVTIEPGGSSGSEPYNHKGEDAGHVLAGALDLYIDEVQHRLRVGDSFRFKSSLPHRFGNPGTRQTKVLWVVTPPFY